MKMTPLQGLNLSIKTIRMPMLESEIKFILSGNLNFYSAHNQNVRRIHQP